MQVPSNSPTAIFSRPDIFRANWLRPGAKKWKIAPTDRSWWNILPGQTLTKARQVYDGVVEGISDVGFSVLAYTRGRFPVTAAVDLPLGYTSGTVATKVINAVYKKFMPQEFMDTQVMYLHAHGPGLIHTKSKPVRKMEDMKGLKFRGHGTSALVVKALGGTPVSKPMPETYQMLQKGVVDGAVYPF